MIGFVSEDYVHSIRGPQESALAEGRVDMSHTWVRLAEQSNELRKDDPKLEHQ